MQKKWISVVPIYGIHFELFVDVINKSKKKCAIMCGEEDDVFSNLELFDGQYLKTCIFKESFEQSLIIPGLFSMFSAAMKEFGNDQTAKNLLEGYQPVFLFFH